MLIVFDLLTLGSGLKMDPYQIGAHTTLGESFLRSVNSFQLGKSTIRISDVDPIVSW